MTYEVRRTNKVSKLDDLYSFPPSALNSDGSEEIKEGEIIEFIKINEGDHMYVFRHHIKKYKTKDL